MKKIIIFLALLLVLSINAFAARPGGLGVGIVGEQNLTGSGSSNWEAALSLKAPSLPIYWGISLEIRNNEWGLGLTGDNYLLDVSLIRNINFGWYLGLGAYAGFHRYNDEIVSWSTFSVGARVPIGIYIMPARIFELFLNLVPTIGMDFLTTDTDTSYSFPEGGMNIGVGLRFWF